MTPAGTKGGQGRRAQQTEDSGIVAGVCMVLLGLIVASMILGKCMGGA